LFHILANAGDSLAKTMIGSNAVRARRCAAGSNGGNKLGAI